MVWLMFYLGAVLATTASTWFEIWNDNSSEEPLPWFVGIFALVGGLLWPAYFAIMFVKLREKKQLQRKATNDE